MCELRAPYMFTMHVDVEAREQVEEEVRRAGQFQHAEDSEPIMPVLRGWLSVINVVESAPEAQQQQSEAQRRPRWRQPPRIVWNALCTLLPLLTEPALEHAVEMIPETVSTIAQAAMDASQHQCAHPLSLLCLIVVSTIVCACLQIGCCAQLHALGVFMLGWPVCS